jgi:hypothetical protein
MESTWQVGSTSYSRLSLRFSLAGLEEPTVRAIVGETAAQVYGLDLDALGKVATTIGAPTYDELSELLDDVPAGASPFAFRTVGPWA